MIDWLRRLIGRKSNVKELARAYELGREAGAGIADTIVAYIKSRGAQIGELYLPILRERLPMVFALDPDSLEATAQQEWLNYLQELHNVRAKLRNEIPERMPEILRSADLVDGRAVALQLIDQEVDLVVTNAGEDAAIVVISELNKARKSQGLDPFSAPVEDVNSDFPELDLAYRVAAARLKLRPQTA